MTVGEKIRSLQDSVARMNHIIDVHQARYAGARSGFRWGFFFGAMAMAIVLRVLAWFR